MQDTDWITVVSELEQQLLTAIITVKELRADMEYRRSTRPAPEQLVMTTSAPDDGRRRKNSSTGRAQHHWTEQETDRMVSMWMRGVPTVTIADDLDRTTKAIQDHARVLRSQGIYLPMRDGTGRIIR